MASTTVTCGPASPGMILSTDWSPIGIPHRRLIVREHLVSIRSACGSQQLRSQFVQCVHRTVNGSHFTHRSYAVAMYPLQQRGSPTQPCSQYMDGWGAKGNGLQQDGLMPSRHPFDPVAYHPGADISGWPEHTHRFFHVLVIFVIHSVVREISGDIYFLDSLKCML